uniref:Ig-like domain-containing protein n=1 Tax=Microbulbifer agarilyticus TaxID=260552 RepID=UPI000255BBE6|nr:Ig-like domain-containing protein [Microbulbifer agarilyticus]
MKTPRTLAALAMLFTVSAPGLAQATDCSALAEWDSATAYNGGAQIQYNGNAYTANWWTRNHNPETHSDAYQEWRLVGTCEGGNQKPEVSLSSPLEGATLSLNDSVIISADASDSDGSVSQVIFLLDGTSLGTDTSPPYSVTWTATAGPHTISAIATDDQGRASDSASVSVNVIDPNANSAPTVSLTNPTAQSQVSAGDSVNLTADAADQDGNVTAVEFFVDDVAVGSSGQAPFAVNWQAVAGTHSFKAIATDNDGASTASNVVSLAVEAGQVGGGCAGVPAFSAGTSYAAGDVVENVNHKYRCDIAGWCSSNAAWAYEPGVGQHWTDAWTDLGFCAIAPELSITQPGDNSTLLAGEQINFSADASDGDGSVAQVEFFAAGQSLGTDTSAPYAINWTVAGSGDVQLKAVATDDEGNSTEATVLVSVSTDPVVATLTAPTSGSQITLGNAISLEAEASALQGSISQVAFLVDGMQVAVDTSAPYSASYTPGALGDYSVTAVATDNAGNEASSTAASVRVINAPVGKKHKLIGYWHNFVNPAGCPIRLREISSAWDIIDIAFADNDRNSDGTVHFNLFQQDIHSSCPPMDPDLFKQDVAELQAQGKIIVLSLGGAEGTITLNTDSDEANFVASLTAIIDEWGFDGLDIDLESGSNLVHGSQIQARLPRALRQIEQNMGGDMYLTMAPEHPYVHGGMVAYSGIWGAYIPLIDALRDTLDLLHVQLYNNGGLMNPYESGAAAEGSVNMMVAHARMLIEGFELADGSQFAPLRDDQVAIGLPSGPSSANSGQAPTQNILDALDCLTILQNCGSIMPAYAYPDFGGVMTWSINWDQHDGYNFSGPVGDKLNSMNAQ